MDNELLPVTADLTSMLETHVNVAASVGECQGDGTTCAECGKVFTHQFYFSNHIATHTAEKTFSVAGQCAVCGLVFSDQGQFNEHMLSVQNRLDAQAKAEAEALEAEKRQQKEASRLASGKTAEKRQGEPLEDGSPDRTRTKRRRKAPDRLSPTDHDGKAGGQDDVDEYLRSLTAMGLTVDPAAFSSSPGKGARSRGGGSGARRGRFGGRSRGGDGRGKALGPRFESPGVPRPKKPSPKYDYVDVDILLSDDLEIMPRSGKDTRAQRLRQRLDRISGDVKVKVEVGAEVKDEGRSDNQHDREKDPGLKVKDGADVHQTAEKKSGAREKPPSDEEEIIILKTEAPRPAPAVKKKPAPAVKKPAAAVKKTVVAQSAPSAVFNGRGYPRAMTTTTTTTRGRQRGQGARQQHVSFQPPGIDSGVTAMTFEGSGIDRLRKEARDYVEKMLNSAPGEMVAPPPLLRTEETLTVHQGETTVIRRPTRGGVASLNYPAGHGFDVGWGGPQVVRGRGRSPRSTREDDRDWTPGRSKKRGTARGGRGSPRGQGSSSRGQNWFPTQPYGRGGRGRGEVGLGRGTADITKELDFSMLHPLSASTEAELQSLVAGSLPLSLPPQPGVVRGREITRAAHRGRGVSHVPPRGRGVIRGPSRGKDIIYGSSRGRGATHVSPRGREVIRGAPQSRPPTARRGQSARGGRGAGVRGQHKPFLQTDEVIVIDDEEMENVARERGRKEREKMEGVQNSAETGDGGGDGGDSGEGDGEMAEAQEEEEEGGDSLNRDEDEIMDGEDIAGWKVSITKDSSSEEEDEDGNDGENEDEDGGRGSDDILGSVGQGESVVPQTLVVNLNTALDRIDGDVAEEGGLGAGVGKDRGDILENGDGVNVEGGNSFPAINDASDSFGVLTCDKGQDGIMDSESETAIVSNCVVELSGSEKTQVQEEEESEDIMDIFSEIERTCKEMEENSEKEDSKDGQSGKREVVGGGEEGKESSVVAERKVEDGKGEEGAEMERKAKKDNLDSETVVGNLHEESRMKNGLKDCADADGEGDPNLESTQSEMDRKCEDISSACTEGERVGKEAKDDVVEEESEVEGMDVVTGMTEGESAGEDMLVDESVSADMNDGQGAEEVSEVWSDRRTEERSQEAEGEGEGVKEEMSVGQDGVTEEQCGEEEERRENLDAREKVEEGRKISGEEEEEQTSMDKGGSAEEVTEGRREGEVVKKRDGQKVEGDVAEAQTMESTTSSLQKDKGNNSEEVPAKSLVDGQNTRLEDTEEEKKEEEIRNHVEGQGEALDEVGRGGIMGWCPLQDDLDEEEEAEEGREEEEGGREDEEEEEGGREDEEEEKGGREDEEEEGGRVEEKGEDGKEEEEQGEEMRCERDGEERIGEVTERRNGVERKQGGEEVGMDEDAVPGVKCVMEEEDGKMNCGEEGDRQIALKLREEDEEEENGKTALRLKEDEEEEEEVERRNEEEGRKVSERRNEDEETTFTLSVGGGEKEGKMEEEGFDGQMVEMLEERTQGQSTLVQGGSCLEERRKECAWSEGTEEDRGRAHEKEDRQTVIEEEERRGETDGYKMKNGEQDGNNKSIHGGTNLRASDEEGTEGVREEKEDGEKEGALLEKGTKEEDGPVKNGVKKSEEEECGNYPSMESTCVGVTESKEAGQGKDETDGEKGTKEENVVESAERKHQGFAASCRDFQDGKRREADDDDDDHNDRADHVSDKNGSRLGIGSHCVDSQTKTPANSSSKQVTPPENGGHNLSSSSLEAHQACGKFSKESDRMTESAVETFVKYFSNPHSENHDCRSRRIERSDCSSCRIEHNNCCSRKIELNDCCSRWIEHAGEMQQDRCRKSDVRIDGATIGETFVAEEFVIKLHLLAPALHSCDTWRSNFLRSERLSIRSNGNSDKSLYGPRQFFHPLPRCIPQQFCVLCNKKSARFIFKDMAVLRRYQISSMASTSSGKRRHLFRKCLYGSKTMQSNASCNWPGGVRGLSKFSTRKANAVMAR